MKIIYGAQAEILKVKYGRKEQNISLLKVINRNYTFSYIFMAGVFDALTKRSTK